MTVKDMINATKLDERVLVAELLTEEMKKNILSLEMKRLEEPIPVINESLNYAFEKDYAMVIVVDKTGEEIAIEDQVPTLTLETDTGKVIGEEIYDPEELELMREDEEAYFISEYFVTFPNMAVSGEKQFFVVGELYNELSSEDKMNEIASSMIMSAPCTSVDHYIKDVYEIPHEEMIVTLIVGFNLEK